MAKLFEYTWTDADQKDWWESVFKANIQGYVSSHFLHLQIAKVLRQKLPLKGKFLEYGCGTGDLLTCLSNDNQLKLYGCADEPSQVETTKQRLQNHIWCCVPPAVEQAWLTKILSLLAPGGYLCVNDCFGYLPQRDTLCPHCGAFFAGVPNVNALTPKKVSDTLGALGVKHLFCKQTTMRVDGQSFLSWQLVKWHDILKYHHQDNFSWIGQKV